VPGPVPFPRTGGQRPLAVTADVDVLDELLRLAATAGVDLEVAADAGAASAAWRGAPLVLVGNDAADGIARRRGARRLPRRDGVVLVSTDLDDAGVWQRAVEVGAERVVVLPDGEVWLVERLAEAGEAPMPEAPVVALLGGRGGAGATTLACALAVTAARTGRRVLLVDGDPLGGGIDLVFGAEAERGLRWPDLHGTRGRLPAAALAEALPRAAGLAVLSWGRGDAPTVPADAVRAVLAAGRRSHDLVVVDLPRSLDDAARAVLAETTRAFVVVPAEVRAAAAAARVASTAALLCADLQVVVRGPAPGGLTASAVTRALGLPLAGELAPETGLAVALERGEAPARRGRGPLWQLCAGLLDELHPALEQAA
jgi:secretion/DNA translocation related CpaE-like protein